MSDIGIKRQYSSQEFLISGDAPEVSQKMGNRLRRIKPQSFKARRYDMYGGGSHIILTGPSIRRDGSLGPSRAVFWSIGGRWDESAEVPAWAMDLFCELEWPEIDAASTWIEPAP